MRNIKFSIVTIVYNEQSYIERTLQSVVNQSYANFEYLVIDGYSTDDTVLIINKYIKNIKFFVSEPDSGLYDAMNKGIIHSTGDYIIFMNGGDRFATNDVLDLLSKELSKDDRVIDFVYGDSYVCYENSEIEFYKKARNAKYLWYGMFANHQAMFYRLSLVKSNNLLFDLNYKISADYKFTVDFLKFCSTKLYINRPFCVFRLGGASVVQRDLGLFEAEKIRKFSLGYTIPVILSIRILIYSARFLEDRLSWLHKYLRFSNLSTN
ncbi:glycosyltransferase family 2 protein [Fibrella forsythiae]|uniref:Glycosyltransferase n=1 Tax=Fibrella forsythiae TaxID=2817061 RepID=A0ABS3JCQ9_9BACT|nr:glycosyltransferase family 2 protein [Fibrella forsythiae]MBO0947780.1 glycosyltransferase [Fibrella forsythiae]